MNANYLEKFITEKSIQSKSSFFIVDLDMNYEKKECQNLFNLTLSEEFENECEELTSIDVLKFTHGKNKVISKVINSGSLNCEDEQNDFSINCFDIQSEVDRYSLYSFIEEGIKRFAKSQRVIIDLSIILDVALSHETKMDRFFINNFQKNIIALIEETSSDKDITVVMYIPKDYMEDMKNSFREIYQRSYRFKFTESHEDAWNYFKLSYNNRARIQELKEILILDSLMENEKKEIVRFLKQDNYSSFCKNVEDMIGYLLELRDSEMEEFDLYIRDYILNKSQNSKLLIGPEVVEDIGENYVGNISCISSMMDKLEIYAMGYQSSKPIGAFLVSGPTGGGKTQLGKSFAKHTNMKLCRIDMNNYSNESDSWKLMGPAPGHVGHEKGGELYQNLIKSQGAPTLLILDEFEKAHSSVRNDLLRAIDEGVAFDNAFGKFTLYNVLILATSNAGALESQAAKEQRVGLYNCSQEMIQRRENEARKKSLDEKFSPEVVARFDEVFFLESPDTDTLEKIIRIKLEDLKLSFMARGREIEFDEDLPSHISKKIESESFISIGGRSALKEIDLIKSVLVKSMKTKNSDEIQKFHIQMREDRSHYELRCCGS